MIENYCVSPNAVEGMCTNLSECPRLNQIYNDRSQQPPAVLEFLRQSQCGDENSNVNVCCTADDKIAGPPVTMPTETTTAAPQGGYDADTRRIVEKLKSPLIPKPPDCGILLEDRIFGGGVAGLTEFLWTVSLKYEDSRLISLILKKL